MNVPTTKTARQAAIKTVLSSSDIHSQAELMQELENKGMSVTQGTLSRDLMDLGAFRVRGEDGQLVYSIPVDGPAGQELASARTVEAHEAKLAALCRELLVSADASANIAVLRTPPGAAQFLASVIDQSRLREILGTIAGDDSIMVISRDPQGGHKLAERFLSFTD